MYDSFLTDLAEREADDGRVERAVKAVRTALRAADTALRSAQAGGLVRAADAHPLAAEIRRAERAAGQAAEILREVTARQRGREQRAAESLKGSDR